MNLSHILSRILVSVCVIYPFSIFAQSEVSASGIGEVFGDGVKLSKVVLTFTEQIDAAKLSPDCFEVEGREITNLLVDDSGTTLVLELKTQTLLRPMRSNPGGANNFIQGPRAGQGSMRGPGQTHGHEEAYVDSVAVKILQPIFTLSGKKLEFSENEHFLATTERILVADDFTQGVFDDQATGINLRYNLFTPRNLEPGKTYPLVLFMHDASGAGKSNIRHTLLQGNGATVWASSQWQENHPCFVLAPQFDQVILDDGFTTTADIDACLNLLDSLLKNLPIDYNRLYTTGQSMGCMASYVLMTRRPELFASAMLVAGQWDPSVLAPLAQKNLWLLSAKGDAKSSAGVAQAIEIWNANGAAVVEEEWPFDPVYEGYDELVEQMLRKGGNIHYSHFAGGDHNNTWRIAYSIKGVREWLFRQHRPLSTDSVFTLLTKPEDSTTFVVAQNGDAHGAVPGSIHALQKAILKGASMAKVEVAQNDGRLLLPSGEDLRLALDSLDGEILLLVSPDSKQAAETLEDIQAKVVLYGESFGTSLPFIARLSADQYSAEQVEKTLAFKPVAVELCGFTEQSAAFSEALSLLSTRIRVCVNLDELSSSSDQATPESHHPRFDADRISSLLNKGTSILMTNEIKPLLNWLEAE